MCKRKKISENCRGIKEADPCFLANTTTDKKKKKKKVTLLWQFHMAESTSLAKKKIP